MSEPRLISPLLDRFAMGGAISNHSGVCCYPAMRSDSDERYIVKVISVPASQVQLEALLLTGAYPNAEAAGSYFLELAEGIGREIEVLNKLASRRGFLPFEGSQIVPMAEGVGYEVYLLSYFRQTLGRHLKKAPLTHLSAVNLGIDLCAALALCRESGYLYVTLKPDNIFINTAAQAYHLGDLGFVALDSLKYASLPDRCRSDYTPPEVEDAFATLNTTMDTYALGLTLYQIYNNGQLPFDSAESKAALMAQLAAGEKLPAPAYADYEMAEIILKACAYAPADRWQTPQEMAEALISYMKRNGANDVPIVPPVVPEAAPLESAEDADDTAGADNPEETAGAPDPEIDENPQAEEEAAAPAPSGDEPQAESADAPAEEASAEPEEGDAPASDEKEADWIDRMDAILAEDATEETVVSEAREPSLRELLETEEDGEAEAVDASALSEDTAAFLNQVQELIDHEAPGPAVAPEPIDVPMPDPIAPQEPEEQPQEETSGEEEAAAPVVIHAEDEEEDYDEDDEVEELSPEGSKTWRRLLTVVILLILLAAGAFGGYYYYQNYYLQEIDSFTVEGQADRLTVTVVTDMDQSLLTVVCKDTYGQVKYASLVNGQATFEQLQPGTQYILTLEVEGFHELVNASPASYSTPERTQIVDLNAITGPDDGTAIVSFGVEGPEGGEWTLTCSAPGEEDKIFTFSGHNYTVVGLTPDVEYTFTLTGDEKVYLIGDHSMTFTARSVIYAENLVVTGYRDNTMTIAWEAPQGVIVEQWTARCYNAEGYDEVVVVSDAIATFAGISADSPYTLEVTAEGMTQSSRTFITANPVIITDVQVTPRSFAVDIQWSFEGSAPANGWLILFTVDNGIEQQVILTDEPVVTIAPAGPGSHYEIIIQTADATSVFNGSASADIPEATGGTFSGYGLRASEIEVRTYRAPDGSWSRKDLTDITTTFSVGDNIAFVFYTSEIYNLSSDAITTTMVLHDSEGNLAAISSRTRSWDDMWQGGYCTDEFNNLPTVPGTYTLKIYLNDKLLSTKEITIR